MCQIYLHKSDYFNNNTRLLYLYRCLSRFLLNKTIDVLLYVDRLDAYRVDTLDGQVVKAISNIFGQEIWHRAILVLTHAQVSPPGSSLTYNEFLSKRSESLLKVVHLGARFNKQDIQVHHLFKISLSHTQHTHAKYNKFTVCL
jgi:hypothetical protein